MKAIQTRYLPATALANVQSVRIARVTNHWDRNDRDNLLSRDYDYITL